MAGDNSAGKRRVAFEIPKEGDLLAGRYRVEGLLGEGGMGYVVAAHHQHMNRRVAIKFLLPEVAENPHNVERFLREARAAARIQSEHVVSIHDVATLEDGTPFMVMEYLQGVDLARLVARGPLPVDDAITYVLQACEALAEAHAAGVVHRDLKPSNLFLGQRADGSPLVKVLDFGISKIRCDEEGKAAPSLTSTSAILGSPMYMSPEQIRSSKDVDARADVWSLGVILHELMTGAPPFNAETLSGLIASIITDPVKPLRSLRPEIPERVENVVLRCLEKDLSRRLQSIGELARSLSPCAPEQAQLSVSRITRIAGVSAAPSVAPPADEVVVSTGHRTQTISGMATTDTGQGRRGAVVWVAVGAAVAIAAAGALLLGAHRFASAVPNVAGSAGQLPAPIASNEASSSSSPIEVLPKPDQVVIEFRVTPSDARIEVDGKAVTGGKLELEQGGQPMKVTASAAGYQSIARDFTPDKSQIVELELAKRAAGQAREPTPTPPKRKIVVNGPVEKEL